MEIEVQDSKILSKNETVLQNGINFVITEEKKIQRIIMEKIDEDRLESNIYINNSLVSTKQLQKYIYYVNYYESTYIRKNVKFKRMIDINSEIVRSLDINNEVFDLQFKQLWHWSYLCSCAIGIFKGKNILVFPWINSKECSVQAYRLYKLSEYAKTHDLLIIIPTDSVDKLEDNPNRYDMEYNIIT